MMYESSISTPDSFLIEETCEKPVMASEPEMVKDEDFCYDGYQVVRGEFFAHISEPSITIHNAKIHVNSACITRMAHVDYVQILVNPDDQKLAIRPCNEDEKDSFLWCTSNSGKRKPKNISCRLFFAKIIQLMDWNPDYRYKFLGKLIRSNKEHLFVFDLTSPEIYQRIIYEAGKPKPSRSPTFPAEWQNQFGLPFEEHRKSLQINIFNGYAVFGIKDTQTSEETPRSGIEKKEVSHR